MEPTLREFSALTPNGFVPIAYWEWGDPDAARTVACVHGLTRHGRDFDALARALVAEGARVAAIDMPGRGKSGWLRADADYGYPVYCAVAAAWLARLGAAKVEWIGTSMGGLIGMMLAAQPETPIVRMVMNDIGPFLPKASLERIATYVAAEPIFAGMDEAEAFFRRVHAPFGALSDAEWKAFAAPSVRRDDSGRLRLHYDPAIGRAFSAVPPMDIDLWPIWDKVTVPTLVLRGAGSDLLLRETLGGMKARGKARVETVEIAGCGHAPALLDPAQIAIVRRFLAAA